MIRTKHILIVLLVALINCHFVNKNPYSPISLLINCSVDSDSFLQIDFNNIGEKNISIIEPCTTNTYIYLSSGNKLLNTQMKIRAYCEPKTFELKTGQTKELTYPIKLSKWYLLEKGKDYNVYVEYITYYQGKIQQRFISETYFFHWNG